MKGARGLLCAAVLLPALLLSGCYKDLEKVRIKPFRPDLVVPLAAADSITVADMLLREVDTVALDKVGSNGRVQFTYLTRAVSTASLKLGYVKDNVLTVERVDGKNKVKEKLFEGANNGMIKAVKTITLEQGAKLKADRPVSLTLKDGSLLQLDNIMPTELLKDCELDFSALSDGLKFIFEKPEEKCVKSAVVELQGTPNVSTMDQNNVKLGLYEGLLWYSGELTDPKVAVTVKREGWLKEAELEYWMEGFYLTRKQSADSVILQRASSSSRIFPFYKKGEGKTKDHASLAAGVDSVSETYAMEETNLNTISAKWPISFNPGTLKCEAVAAQEVTFTKGDALGSPISASVALKLPLTGKFHALVREFKAGDADGVVLPDVNELLLKDKEKKDAAVKMKLTDQDTVLLHFYFVNGTPFEVYLAARVGGKNVAERGKSVSSLRKASEIEQNNGSTAIDDKVGDFGFFEAVGAAAIDAGQRGITKVGGASKKRVTLAIPYSLYEEARTAQTGEAKRLRAMLLFRSPGNSDPQEVSPRMSDYLSVRLGVEVKPELEIELINKK